MSAEEAKRWRLVHSWSSVICTAFLLVLCATGLPLVFRDEIETVLAPHPHTRALAGAEPLSLARLEQLLRERDRSRHPAFVFFDEADPNIIGFGMTDADGGGLDHVTRMLLDARTGEVLSAAPAESGVIDTLADVHRNLCAGVVGDVLLGVMSLMFLVSLVSGVVVYMPLLRRIGFGALRRARDRRIVQLDLHNLAGSVGVLWALVVGATGFINTLEAPLFAAWDAATLPALLAPYAGQAPLGARCSIDRALAAARVALPEMRPTSIGLPETAFGSPRHYLVWLRGDTFFTSRLFTPVLIDAASGTVASARPFPWYLRVLEASRPLHFGDYGGLPLKVLWALFDAALVLVLGSGLYLFVRRLRAPHRQ